MLKGSRILNSMMICLMVLPFCLSSCQTTSPTASADVLYLNIIWHQHQPLYYTDANSVITRPWVRVHATKDYYDMAATVAKYPNVHVTFNITPVLMMQLDEYVNQGAKDSYWVLAEKPADQLTPAEKEFLLTRFFDANWDHMIRPHPGYKRLLDKRGGSSSDAIRTALESFSMQDYLDLQIWFNLAWMDPDWLENAPLDSLVAKDHAFTEADKQVVFNETRRIMKEVIPIHKQLLEKGQIEVITSPLAHPILPLIYDTNLALKGNPQADMPRRFNYVQDGIAQLTEGRQLYQEHFGSEPVGLWPSEGAVAAEIVPLVANSGYQWMASGEQVLANSLGIGAFSRNGQDTVLQADQLYRPYWVSGPADGPIQGKKVLMVFRDNLISDKVGFTYSGTPGVEAADDFMQRMENIRTELKSEGAQGPHLVSIILDGENAWENYDHDGKEFLNALYSRLSESKTIQTMTVTDYLKKFPEQQDLPDLFPGAWFSANYDTWVGDPEEKAAWNLLGTTRADLEQAILEGKKQGVAVAGQDAALQQMYLAEGSDWFWWYGADQDSGNDAYFDEGFRALLRNVYLSLQKNPPAALQVPIIPAVLAPADREISGMTEAKIDGIAGADEWQPAALYTLRDAGETIRIGINDQQLSLALDSNQIWADLNVTRVDVYLSSPRMSKSLGYALAASGSDSAHLTLLGFSATHLISLNSVTVQAESFTAGKNDWEPDETQVQVAEEAQTLEAAVPLDWLGALQAGDEIRFRVVLQTGDGETVTLPAAGPGRVLLPDLSDMTTVLQLADPTGDDHGPGTYTYPIDSVFTPGVFDITSFKVRYDDQNIAFDFTFSAEITNPWNGPASYSLQTLDVYIDQDPGQGTGAKLLLPGRNAALANGDGWDLALWAESWTPQVLTPDPSTLEPKPVNGVTIKIILNPAAHGITLMIPRSTLRAGDPAEWAYAAMVLSQDGYPTEGVWRVRDVQESAAQWRIGGGPADSNHTRILDLAWPEGASSTQEGMLSDYPPLQNNAASFPPESLARIQMLQK